MSLQTQTLRSKKPVAIKTEASLSVFAYGQAHFFLKPLTFLTPTRAAHSSDRTRFYAVFERVRPSAAAFFKVLPCRLHQLTTIDKICSPVKSRDALRQIFFAAPRTTRRTAKSA
ncbi:hypothetical protein [Comamonas sp. Tr-654]|uniref:hypothetical protein n=1 Tax=Comamonas sp. Tr-654 TaxID=2608341 RepID=UPI0019650809|nr:hypothetical protein [Comamonas sp. Tr-654]